MARRFALPAEYCEADLARRGIVCDLAGTTKKENIAPRLWLKGDDTIASGGWRKRRADEDPMLNNWKEPDSVPGARALHAAKRGRTAQAALMAAVQAAKPKLEPLKVGTRVRIEGLMRRTDLNGAEATVLKWIKESRRWAVHCDGELGCVVFEVKEDNLLLLSTPAQRGEGGRENARNDRSLPEQSAPSWQREFM